MPSYSPGKIHVAVLRGGPSREYDTSLETGAHLLSLLREMPDKYEPIDIFISKDHEWHRDGMARPPHLALKHANLVWNAMHGDYGEDGRIQQILSAMHMPHTGGTTMPSVFSMNKDMSKNIYKLHGIRTAQHEILDDHSEDSDLIRIFRTYLHPLIVKPAAGSSSFGIKRVHTFNELVEAVKELSAHTHRVLVEELVRGKDTSCTIVEGVRGQKFYALLPTGKQSTKQNKQIEEMARQAHRALGLRHYSTSDFVITPRGNVYILETNSAPVFTKESQLTESLRNIGWPPKEFVNHIVHAVLHPRIIA